LGQGRIKKFSIPSNSTNQGGVVRKVFEQLGVGKAPVDDDSQVARVLLVLLSIELITEKVHPAQGDFVNVGRR
jgi:hypothetical protein